MIQETKFTASFSRGSGEPKVTRYNSMVYRNNQTPTWGELMKLDISSETIEICHLFFTFRNRQEKTNQNNNGLTQPDRPFAFAYLPLFSINRTFIPDGEHSLVLFKYDEQSAMPEVYCRVRATLAPGQTNPEITPALSKLLIPLKDSFVTLTKLKFASEVEICKFLRNIFDALFGVLVSRANSDTREYEELVFNALVTLLGIVSDRRFTNFKPVVDLYIDHHFSSTAASTHLLHSFQNLLNNPTSPKNAHPLRCSIKVWGYLMRFIVRSRDLQRITEFEWTVERPDTTDSSSIIGTQTLAVQHFASLLIELAKVFTPLELLEKANAFCESIKVTKGKIVMETDNDVFKHSARVTWLEGIRIAVAVIAVALDKLHKVLIDPTICNAGGSLAQEHDNIEYLLGLLPKLLDSFREFESPANVEIVQRLGTTASVISSVPIVFPATYPHPMGNPNDPNNHAYGGQQNSPPTVQNALGEIAVVMITMIMLAPTRMLKNHFELMLEVEGKVNFGKFLSKIFKAFYSILKNVSFPSNWLNMNVISHKAILKLLEVVSKILQREFIPASFQEHEQTKRLTKLKRAGQLSEDQEGSGKERFDSNLWSDFFVLNHGLLSSKLLIIEEYRPEAPRNLETRWRYPQNPQSHSDPNSEDEERDSPSSSLKSTKSHGVAAIRFSSCRDSSNLCWNYVCLNHDELRSNAVMVLYSVIVSEFNLNRDFTVIADEIIDKLDNLLGSSPNENLNNQSPIVEGNSEDQQRGIEPELKAQINLFLDSLSQFLDLLLSIRNLPPGNEFINDRVIGPLKLMSFIRNIGRSGIYIHYDHTLVNFHAAHGNFAEAGYVSQTPHRVLRHSRHLALPVLSPGAVGNSQDLPHTTSSVLTSLRSETCRDWQQAYSDWSRKLVSQLDQLSQLSNCVLVLAAHQCFTAIGHLTGNQLVLTTQPFRSDPARLEPVLWPKAI
ncbi:hypothetical protein PCASD_24233 [Puccinia coronata f. sp. avenae]|uniref:C2 DOCK-type domain-containing protein n=1 Tax=Puccinia coronata f. sp. avenae TaxID=200324 RepID=A0A2N5THF9_9BASI|nr:hypothetical protein PCASD_24233 [Puccinia coronata f. sp. avenae]